jgi:hypothetical protein
MDAEFYLFDVDHGQSAALRLPPYGSWCIFDIGAREDFSPVKWIVKNAADRRKSDPRVKLLLPTGFKFLRATISHYHSDHLTDWPNFIPYRLTRIRSVALDRNYFDDCKASNMEQSWPNVLNFIRFQRSNTSQLYITNSTNPVISERGLPAPIVEKIGGDANVRVNNRSIITRINIFGTSILLCGDMMKEAWEKILSDKGQNGASWRLFVSNIDILVAPHHGHKSGYSVDLLTWAQPKVVLISRVSKDLNVDTRYSDFPVKGITIGNNEYHRLSTADVGHIKVGITLRSDKNGASQRSWSFGDEALVQ